MVLSLLLSGTLNYLSLPALAVSESSSRADRYDASIGTIWTGKITDNSQDRNGTEQKISQRELVRK